MNSKSMQVKQVVAVLAPFLLPSVAWAQVAVTNRPDPLLTNLAIPAGAPSQGMWSSVKRWPLVGIHSALMPSGVVMTYGTPLGQGVQDGRTFDL